MEMNANQKDVGKNLEVFQASFCLAAELFRKTKQFPIEVFSSLTNPIMQSATKTAGRILEWCETGTARFLKEAQNHQKRLAKFLEKAQSGGYLKEKETEGFKEQIESIKKEIKKLY